MVVLSAKADADPVVGHFVEDLRSWEGLREWASWIARLVVQAEVEGEGSDETEREG